MSKEKYFLKLISEENPSIAEKCILKGLSLLEKIYLKIISEKNKKIKKVRVNVPVISVGNITAGGTGKTPCIIQLGEYLQKKGKRVAVLSRGYRGTYEKQGGTVSDGKTIFLNEKEAGDEPCMIAHKLPEVSVYVGKNRIKSAQKAIKNGSEILLLDDGFQYKTLERDKNIVLIDSTNPFGYEHLLPRGLLREPLDELKRADLIILTKVNQVSKERINEVKARILSINSSVTILESLHKPVYFFEIKENAKKIPLEVMKGKKAVLLSGIGNPAAFEKTAKESGLEICKNIAKKDHFSFAYIDIEKAVNEAKIHGADIIVTTEKDAIKLKDIIMKNDVKFPIYSLCIEMKYLEKGEEKIQKYLEELI